MSHVYELVHTLCNVICLVLLLCQIQGFSEMLECQSLNNLTAHIYIEIMELFDRNGCKISKGLLSCRVMGCVNLCLVCYILIYPLEPVAYLILDSCFSHRGAQKMMQKNRFCLNSHYHSYRYLLNLSYLSWSISFS